MNGETFILNGTAGVRTLITWLGTLNFRRPWRVVIEQIDERAGTDQEAVLRGKEGRIAKECGETQPYIHDLMLWRHYGGEIIYVGGGDYFLRPNRRTRTGPNPLNRSEMNEHMRFVDVEAAHLGIYLP